MIQPKTWEAWKERAESDGDIRDMLGVIDRLSEALRGRQPIAEVDPTGGADPKFNWGGDP